MKCVYCKRRVFPCDPLNPQRDDATRDHVNPKSRLSNGEKARGK